MAQNIVFSGFSKVDADVKDMAEQKAQRFFEDSVRRKAQAQILRITLKVIHERAKSEIYELSGVLEEKGCRFAATASQRNLLLGMDELLRKLQRQYKSIS